MKIEIIEDQTLIQRAKTIAGDPNSDKPDSRVVWLAPDDELFSEDRGLLTRFVGSDKLVLLKGRQYLYFPRHWLHGIRVCAAIQHGTLGDGALHDGLQDGTPQPGTGQHRCPVVRPDNSPWLSDLVGNILSEYNQRAIQDRIGERQGNDFIGPAGANSIGFDLVEIETQTESFENDSGYGVWFGVVVRDRETGEEQTLFLFIDLFSGQVYLNNGRDRVGWLYNLKLGHCSAWAD